MGRLECEAHYNGNRSQIDAWLRERGKQRLVAERAEYVRARRRAEAKGLTRRDMAAILDHAFPVRDQRKFTSPRDAQAAARFLQQIRNDGWIVTRAPNGMWRVGLKLLTAGELVDLAKAKGFQS